MDGRILNEFLTEINNEINNSCGVSEELLKETESPSVVAAELQLKIFKEQLKNNIDKG